MHWPLLAQQCWRKDFPSQPSVRLQIGMQLHRRSPEQTAPYANRSMHPPPPEAAPPHRNPKRQHRQNATRSRCRHRDKTQVNGRFARVAVRPFRCARPTAPARRVHQAHQARIQAECRQRTTTPRRRSRVRSSSQPHARSRNSTSVMPGWVVLVPFTARSP